MNPLFLFRAKKIGRGGQRPLVTGTLKCSNILIDLNGKEHEIASKTIVQSTGRYDRHKELLFNKDKVWDVVREEEYLIFYAEDEGRYWIGSDGFDAIDFDDLELIKEKK